MLPCFVQQQVACSKVTEKTAAALKQIEDDESGDNVSLSLFMLLMFEDACGP